MDMRGEGQGAHPADDAAPELHRVVGAFVELDVRIARLSQALGLGLGSDEDLQRILDRTAPGFDRAPARLGGAVGLAPDRAWVEREELRGLLVVRFDLVKRTLTERGLEATRQIVSMAELELTRHGFAPGADGCLFLRRLEAGGG